MKNTYIKDKKVICHQLLILTKKMDEKSYTSLLEAVVKELHLYDLSPTVINNKVGSFYPDYLAHFKKFILERGDLCYISIEENDISLGDKSQNCVSRKALMFMLEKENPEIAKEVKKLIY